MSRPLGDVIADSLQLGLAYAERLLTDVSPSQFARFARPGGVVVESNHAAFLLGHLALYSPRIVDNLGGDAARCTPPESSTTLFSKDATCQDDPDGSIYPPLEAVRDQFFHGYQAALETLRATDDAAFQQANSGPLAERFPTIGSMHTFYAGGHLMLHLGQMSAWRRMWGLPPA